MQDTNDFDKLKLDLIDAYPKLTGPYRHVNDTLDVFYSSIIYGLVSVNDKEETVEYSHVEAMFYVDPHLAWDPGAYGGIDQMTIYRESIWWPDVHSSARLETNAAIPREENRVTLASPGWVAVMEPAVIKVKCALDGASFPFDSMVCTQHYRSGMYGMAQMNIFASYYDPMLSYRNHSEYDMVS